jgi:hypothetical protein
MRNSDWTARQIAQVIGWGLMFFGVIFLFGGFVGEGGGASQEPGSDTIRAMIFDRGAGRIALGLIGLGLLAALASLFMRRDARRSDLAPRRTHDSPS